ncbi:putative RNA-binding Zn ribbon-like protein [Lipingzhangella halophila]|uniref:Putative RNA-binding Zn ribbon-like protein n=1 Tax=Lipingzhangella halophila TaxID=1783352 RepID=A0A7W7W727_9ACTN|nr:ABATE domain-containing protein [Lipingzhangella halophila]MBB4935475.1 putative RNA-binding Zn ribbon-like protein [Lipingzhangella halophila]
MNRVGRSWIWDGGQLCVDFVNTLRDRWRGGREELREPADLAEWFTAAGLTAHDVALTEGHVAQARELRAAIDEILRGCAGRHPVSGDAIDTVNRFLREGHQAPPQLRHRHDGQLGIDVVEAGDPAATTFGRIARDMVDFLVADRPGVVRVCDSDRCGLRFVDRSPARNRRWCSMSRCGNRAKARLHYARTTSADG